MGKEEEREETRKKKGQGEGPKELKDFSTAVTSNISGPLVDP